MLVVFQTHPVQYHAPVFRAVQAQHGIPVTAIYGSDFSVAGYRDQEFGASFAWDTDLLSGYTSIFLSRVADGGAASFDEVRTDELAAALGNLTPSAALVAGYSPAFHRSAFLAAWRRRLPILFRAEVSPTPQTGSVVKRAVRAAALRTLYARCARVLYIGVRAREHYEAYGVPDAQLVFSPYCVDTAAFRTGEAARASERGAMRASLGIDTDTLVLLQSGKLTPKKRPDLLLEAARTLPSRLGRQVAVVLVGDGELRPALEQTAAALPGVRVHITGFRNQRELSPYYHAADVAVLPSQHSETWGLVVNEALAHGLPCVVSSVVGCGPDLVRAGDTGAVFEVGSADALADALVAVLPLVGQTSTRERCRAVAQHYSVEAAAAGIAAAYREVVRA